MNRKTTGNSIALNLQALFLSMLVSNLHGLPASCQTKAGDQSALVKYKRDDNRMRSCVLQEMPDLPDLPRFKGRFPTKFSDGAIMPNAFNGQIIIYKFFAKEPVKSVLAWYQKELTAHGWKIDTSLLKAVPRNITLPAWKPGEDGMCTISIRPVYATDAYHTWVMVYCRLKK